MKRALTCYRTHQYAGPRVSAKRSKAALKRFHGREVETRADAWGSKKDTVAEETPLTDTPMADSSMADTPMADTPVTDPTSGARGSKKDTTAKDVTHSPGTLSPGTHTPVTHTPMTDIQMMVNTTRCADVSGSKKDSITRDATHTPVTDSTSKPAETFKTYAIKRRPNVMNPLTSTPNKVSSPAAVNINWPPPPDVTDHQLTVEVDSSQKKPFTELDGYRVVDIRHMLNWALRLQIDHARECTCALITFKEENRDGLESIFTFQCFQCDKYFYVTTDPQKKLNTSFVWGTLTSASHYSQASQLLSSMDIPGMTPERFRKTETSLGTVWEDHLLQEMLDAGRQEKEAALAKGHVGPDGIPYIMVYVDGGWSKRTYGHNFNASSGTACIIGTETKKCLFLGVRNKYCSMCAFNEKNDTTKTHLCFRNYEGSSTGMEANILVEGFTKSVEMHGLRFTSFVGDGDSSVFARLKEKVPYGNIIKKKECKNHVIKNYTSSLYKISADTKLSLPARKILKTKLTRLTTVARLNIKQDTAEKIRRDLKNGMLHVFGDHQQCETYYCRWKQASDKGEPLESDENFVPIMKKDILTWAALETALENISRKADRLTANETNNVAENFMSLMAKYTCGKRIHLSRKGSYQRRAHIAGLCQISGQKWQNAAMKSALGKSPGTYFKKNIERQVRSAAARAKLIRRRLFKKKQQKPCAAADKDYGPKADDPSPELSQEDLESQCRAKLQELQIESQSKIEEIQQQTVGQHGNTLYDQLRKDRLTASQFGMICKRRQGTATDNHVKAVLYKTGFANMDTRYGQNLEKVAIRLFEIEKNKNVVPAGLFIDDQNGFLGASPDGIVTGENAIVEVKTFPSLARSGQTLTEAAQQKKSFCLKLGQNGQLELKKNHNFYYQIQGQLHVTKMTKCYFIMFISNTKPITILEIDRDISFIQNMVPKLETFYKNSILPELVLRRLCRN